MYNESTLLVPESLALRTNSIFSAQAHALIEDLHLAFLIVLSIVGLVTNSMNIKAFSVIGKDDGITISLLSLSISDFGFCASCLLHIILFVLMKLEASFDTILLPVDPWAFAHHTNIMIYASYNITSLNTTFLAVARCLCVAKPLQFGQTFTKNRSIGIHVCLAIVTFAGYIPIMTQSGLQRGVDVRTNTSRYVTWFSNSREEIKDVVFFIFDTIFTFISQIVLIICVFIMTNSLRKSGKFRQSIKTNESKEDGASETQTYKFSGKELQVMQQILLIVFIFIVCSLLRVCIATYSLIEPEFDLQKQYHALYLSAARLRKIFELINSSSTFFIYFKYNSRFRHLFFGPKHNK